MGKIKISIWVGILMTLASCAHQSRREKETLSKIEQIWDLSDHDLTSASQKCRLIQNAVYTCSDYTRMRYDLLCIRIRDKSNMPPSSIDSTRKVTTFMERRGSKKDIMRAYYYMASAYEELNDNPHSVEYTLKSLELAKDKQACDTAIALKCYSQLSYIYRRLHNPQESINMALTGLRLAEQAGLADAWYIMDAATSYKTAGNSDKCISYCEKAYQQLFKEKQDQANAPLISEMTQYFLEYKEYNKVDTLISLLEVIPEHEFTQEYNFAKAAVYEARGETDSAIAYYTKDLTYAPNPSLRQASTFHLFSLYYHQNKYELAAKYALQYIRNKQATDKAEQREWTRNAKGLYSYQKDKEHEEALTRENEAMRFWGTMGFCILLIIIVSLVAIYYYHRKKLLEEALGKDRKLSKLHTLLISKAEEIEEKEKSLNELKQRTEELRATITKKRREMNEAIRMSNLSTTRISMPDIALSLERSAREGKAMSEELWQQLTNAIDQDAPAFREEITERIPRLSESMLRTAYLVKIGMTNQQIEILTGSPHQTTWNRVKRIKGTLATKQ